MIEVNGVAHVILTVSDWERSRAFYEAFLAFLGLTRVFAGDDFVYYVGGRTALGISRAEGKRAAERFEQGTIGLHHVCFRCRSREDVDKAYAFLRTQPVTIVHGPEEGPWAPEYYSVLFEDPAGIRVELNHVPGKGLLAEGASFEAAEDYR
jgi:catechol 2,3-dioxygenase-like lactoylglutathione lyase family enzyme